MKRFYYFVTVAVSVLILGSCENKRSSEADYEVVDQYPVVGDDYSVQTESNDNEVEQVVPSYTDYDYSGNEVEPEPDYFPEESQETYNRSDYYGD